jgi:hypothetical protein
VQERGLRERRCSREAGAAGEDKTVGSPPPMFM